MHRSKSATRFLRIFILSCFSALSIACTGEGSTAPGGAGGAAGGGGEGGAGGLTQKTCTLNEDGPGPDGALDLEVEVVAEGLEVPWALAFLPNGDILVTERPGRLRLIREGEVLPAPVLEVEVAEVEVSSASKAACSALRFIRSSKRTVSSTSTSPRLSPMRASSIASCVTRSPKTARWLHSTD